VGSSPPPWGVYRGAVAPLHRAWGSALGKTNPIYVDPRMGGRPKYGR